MLKPYYILKPDPDFTIYTNASLTGRGITDGVSSSRELLHKSDVTTGTNMKT